MIKKFDKHGAAALYKREFGEAVADGDYENAFDYLLKYSEEVVNPDFHMACGMLYLLMIQESDDQEFLTLAFREFLLHIRKHPNCEAAYRNILAVILLRREARPLIEWSEYIKSKGFDLENMLSELSSAGIDVFTGESEFLDIESMFAAGEFGSIDPHSGDRDRASADTECDTVHTENEHESHSESIRQNTSASKIIRFRGVGSDDARNGSQSESAHGAMLKFNYNKKTEDIADQSSDTELDAFDFIMQMLKAPDGEETAEDGFSIDIDMDGGSPQKKEELRARMALINAEESCARGKYDEALSSLDKIYKSDGRLYYCAECVRAYIQLERDDLSGARKSLENALAESPHGALAGTLQCKFYEKTEQTDRIPDVLNNIDVKDFIDCDHVYRAMRLAMRYCPVENALDLAEDYIDEYNIMDIRLLYAQLLYNTGDKDGALAELYVLSRIFYDDFNVMFYYIMAKTDTEQMPLVEEAPQELLGIIVDNVISYLQNGVINFEEDMLPVGLELFLTLEFDNDRKTTVTMFDALKKLVHIDSHREKVRESLVSPYVEPLVKAVILSELFESGEHEFFMEVGYCPIDGASVAKPPEDYFDGFLTAYAFIATLYPNGVKDLFETADSIKDRADLRETAPRDIANYLIRKVKGNKTIVDKSTDRRLDYALGYESKSAAAQAFKRVSALLKDETQQ